MYIPEINLALTDTERSSLKRVLMPYVRAVSAKYPEVTRKLMLSHLIGRDIKSSKELSRWEYEQVLNEAVPGWRHEDWTPAPAFAAKAAKLAAGYALVAEQKVAAYVPPRRMTAKEKRKARKLRRREQMR